MASIKKFEDLEIWQLARKLCITVFECYQTPPFFNDFELKNQINRSSGSIMDNIAEGFERNGNKELITFLGYAKASCGEVKSQIYRAYDRKYLESSKYEELILDTNTLGIKIGAFMSYLRKTDLKGVKFKEN